MVPFPATILIINKRIAFVNNKGQKENIGSKTTQEKILDQAIERRTDAFNFRFQITYCRLKREKSVDKR